VQGGVKKVGELLKYAVLRTWMFRLRFTPLNMTSSALGRRLKRSRVN